MSLYTCINNDAAIKTPPTIIAKKYVSAVSLPKMTRPSWMLITFFWNVFRFYNKFATLLAIVNFYNIENASLMNRILL